MIEFDEKYFTDIWGTVHRHDYCPGLAKQLADKYGKVRILDIGTGCGYLVKCLQELGIEAWGLEISEYAVANTCAPGFVLLGSVTKIPFKDNSFDVVHSQGLWEYVSEQDIPKAVKEVYRVGKIQVHNIDTIGSGIGESDFVTVKTRDWWDERLKLRLNLGCGNYHLDGYFNIDLHCSEADIVHDLLNPLPYNNNSVDEIYASHIIEHFSREEWEKIKRDWFRVLKVGGKLHIECPELEVCIKKYLEDKSTDYWLKTIYGSQEDSLNFHKNGFDYKTLTKELSDLGFSNFQEDRETDYNLILEAYKNG